MDTLGIALSGMQSADRRIAASAQNVANLLSEGYRPLRVVQTSLQSGGSRSHVRRAPEPTPIQLEREIVDQIAAEMQYSASARVFQVGAELHGSLLDIFA